MEMDIIQFLQHVQAIIVDWMYMVGALQTAQISISGNIAQYEYWGGNCQLWYLEACN